MLSIGTATSKRSHARYTCPISGHFSEALGTKLAKQIRPSLLNAINISRLTCIPMTTCQSLSFRVIKSTQEVREEVLLNIRCIIFAVLRSSVRSLLQARKGENAEKHSKLLTIVDYSATYSPSLWILSPLSERCRKRRQYCSPVNVQNIKIKCGNNLCVQRCDIYAPIPSACRF